MKLYILKFPTKPHHFKIIFSPVTTPSQESTFIHFYLAKTFTSGLPVTHTLIWTCLTVMLKPGLKTSLPVWTTLARLPPCPPSFLHYSATMPLWTKSKGLRKKPDWNAQNAVTSKEVFNRWTERKFLQPDYKLWALGLRSFRGWACFSRAESTDKTDPEHTQCLFFPPLCSWQSLFEAGTELCAVSKREKELKDHSCCNIPSPGGSGTSLEMVIPQGRLPEGSSPSLPHLTRVTHTTGALCSSGISQVHGS